MSKTVRVFRGRAIHHAQRKFLWATGLCLFIAGLLWLGGTAWAIDPPRWWSASHSPDKNAVRISWPPVTGAKEYKVLRSTTAGSGYVEIGTTIATGRGGQHYDKDISLGETYYYVIQTVAVDEVSTNSQEKSVGIPSKVVKPPVWKDVTPQLSTEYATNKTVSEVVLSWQRHKGNDIAYNVYRSETPGSGYTKVASTETPRYIDRAPPFRRTNTYYYVVTAIDAYHNETPFSEERSAEMMVVKKKRNDRRPKMLYRKTILKKTIKSGNWGELKQPGSMVLAENGDMYILDTLQGKVFVFSSDGSFLFTFGEAGPGPGQLQKPQDIAISPDDEVYVAGSSTRVEVFSLNGSHRRTIPLANILSVAEENMVSGIFCGPDYWYLSSGKNHTVYTLGYDSNEVVSQIGGLGKEPGQLRGPCKVYLSPTIGLVVADTFNFRVQVFRGGEPVVIFGTYGLARGQFARIISVAEDDRGNILAADFMNNTVQAFSLEGNVRNPYGKVRYLMGNETGDGQINVFTPSKIVFRNKTLYVVNKEGAQVDIFDVSDEIAPPVKRKGSR